MLRRKAQFSIHDVLGLILDQGTNLMRRREFITLLGGAVVWPFGVRAQEPMTPVIGFLSGRSPFESEAVVTAFRQGLSETGYSETSVIIEYRWAEGRYDRLPALAGELVSRRVAVIAG